MEVTYITPEKVTKKKSPGSGHWEEEANQDKNELKRRTVSLGIQSPSENGDGT